jgi:hypothetical protein
VPEAGTIVPGDPWSWVRTYAAPIGTLIVAVALVGGLVLGGILEGDAERTGPAEAPTTVPTIIIEP